MGKKEYTEKDIVRIVTASIQVGFSGTYQRLTDMIIRLENPDYFAETLNNILETL